MSGLLPDPVPLDPPPGSADAVDDAAGVTSRAAHRLDELADGVRAAGAPGWEGRDAEAAEDRRLLIARLGADGAAVLHRVALRLAGHADVLREVTARTTELRAAQEADFAVARARVAVPFDPEHPMATPPGEVVASLVAAEAGRRAEHARLTARVDDDAGDMVWVLAAAAAAVAGTPRYDPDAALMHLAALLPAWGSPELARRGQVLARFVREGAETEQLRAAATADLDVATDPAYAAAFLDALGADLSRAWLVVAGGEAADDPRTELLARVLAGLDRDGGGPAWLPGLLDGAADGELGAVAGGLGAVLARARTLRLPGPPASLAAAWLGSLARDEKANGRPTDLGIPPVGADPSARDPLALLAGSLRADGGAEAAARAMADPDGWAVVLSRFWDDPAVRDSLVAVVGEARAEVAAPALRSALVALGTGLEDGDPDDWALYLLEDRVADVAPVLTTALLRHPDVLVAPLAEISAGRAGAGALTALRGLAVTVALDEGTELDAERGIAGDRIAAALAATLAAPHPAPLADGATVGGAAAAFVGVREHGARLAHALSQHVLRDRAEAQVVVYRSTVGLPSSAAALVPSTALPAVVADAGLGNVLGVGAWTNSADVQRHHPVSEAVAAVGAGDRARAARVHGDTLTALGAPAVPQAPRPTGLVEAEVDAVAHELVGGWIGKRLGLPDPVGGLIGGALLDEVEKGWSPDPVDGRPGG